jgi:hypothetical protein
LKVKGDNIMTNPNHGKPGHRPGGGGPDTPDSQAPGSGAGDKNSPPGSSGRVVHDSRGNAVWQWVKDTGRHALESTSALLRKLEMPDLKVEDHKDTELRLEDDVDAGGGYDPYGTRVGTKKAPPRQTPLPPTGPTKKR